jgi:hypothetical protein
MNGKGRMRYDHDIEPIGVIRCIRLNSTELPPCNGALCVLLPWIKELPQIFILLDFVEGKDSTSTA